MNAYLVHMAQCLGRTMKGTDADPLSVDDLLLAIHAAPAGEFEFLLLANFIKSFQAVQSFSDGGGAEDNLAAAKSAHEKKLAALKAKIEALEEAESR